jgi:hypothetical protein
MPMELAVQTHLEKPVELAVQAQLEVELQTEEEVRAALSAG